MMKIDFNKYFKSITSIFDDDWKIHIFPFGISRFSSRNLLLKDKLYDERKKIENNLDSHNDVSRDLILQKSDELRDKYNYVNDRYILIAEIEVESRAIRLLIILFFLLTVGVYFPTFTLWSLFYLLIGLQIQHIVSNYYHEKIELQISYIVDGLEDKIGIIHNLISPKSYFRKVLSIFLYSLLRFFLILPLIIMLLVGCILLGFGEDMVGYIMSLVFFDFILFNWNFSSYLLFFGFLFSYFPLLKLLFWKPFQSK